jgi:hypothetical protein
MVNILGNELFSAIISTAVGALLTILAYWSQKIYQYFKTRNVRRFWKPFINEKITIIITEYPISGSDRLSNIAKTAGAGWLISKGMALSLAHLLDFCEGKVTKRKDIAVCGDRTGALETSDMVILGSPANNPYSRSMYEHLSKMYNIPYQIIWDLDGTPIEISAVTGEKFSPSVENGIGNDYALIIKADYQLVPQKSLLIIAGCYMWGTKAAAEAVTDAKILNEIAKETKNSSNLAFIIKTRVVNDNSIGPEIDIENKRFIHELILKTKPLVDSPDTFRPISPISNHALT